MPDVADPALAAAARRQSALTLSATVAAIVAGAAPATGWYLRDYEVATVLGLVGAIAGLVTLALGCTWLVDDARARLAQALAAKTHADQGAAPVTTGLLTAQGQDSALAISGETRRLGFAATWGQGLLALPFAALDAASLVLFRPETAAAAEANLGELGLGVTLIVLAFPALIAERRLLAASPANFPEASALARLVRLLVWTLVLGGGAGICRALDLEAARWVQWVVAGLLAGITVELTLRALVTPFLPVTRSQEARGLGDSLITALLLSRSASGAFGSGLKERFGIDLAQSWAIRFLRRAALPLGTLLVLIAWLLSGVTTLGVSERGVYERCGAPVAVLAPGLHLHLPWPFGQVVRLDYGQVHELALGNDSGDLGLPEIAADADTPADFDRVWDRSHPADSSYLVPGPSASGMGTSHQLLNADVRVLWRVRLSDAAALAHAYRVADPAALVRSRARQRLQQTFSVRPLASFIGDDRDRLAGQLQGAIQGDLDAVDSGIEITALIVDAIHPPKEVVPNYHGVQAAEILSRTDKERAKALATSTKADASREAVTRLAQGQANAGEALANARAKALTFRADLDAFAAAPAAMRQERWLQTIGRSLNQANLTIIDHRLTIDGGSTIDLRKAPGNE